VPTLDESEQIILATDDNVEVTTISVEKINDDSEEIVITTDNNIDITKFEFNTTKVDDSEVLEFKSDNESETYAKIGSIDGSSGLFVDNIYDLNGNILFSVDSSNDILILAGKKYKMIPYVE